MRPSWRYQLVVAHSPAGPRTGEVVGASDLVLQQLGYLLQGHDGAGGCLELLLVVVVEPIYATAI